MAERKVDVITTQIVDTLSNMRSEVDSNGITEAANDMWSHALQMYRRYKMAKDVVDTAFDDTILPMFLQSQAD